jgi:hypothetical protein
MFRATSLGGSAIPFTCLPSGLRDANTHTSTQLCPLYNPSGPQTHEYQSSRGRAVCTPHVMLCTALLLYIYCFSTWLGSFLNRIRRLRFDPNILLKRVINIIIVVIVIIITDLLKVSIRANLGLMMFASTTPPIPHEKQVLMPCLAYAQTGLRELTSEISKLVNLKHLTLERAYPLESMPESISCLQKLQRVDIVCGPPLRVPMGFATLANLSQLSVRWCPGSGWQLPPSLQVSSLNAAALRVVLPRNVLQGMQ